MNCEYCQEHGLIHVDGVELIKHLRETSPEDRIKEIPDILVKLDSDKSTHHTALAKILVEDAYCLKCGYSKERYEDDDRYIYICLECVN